MKNLFKKFKKPLILISIAVILSVGLFWHFGFGKKTADKANLAANVSSSLNNDTAASPAENVEVLDQVDYNNEIIPLLWTDNNDNENLIIKTDRQYYDAGEQTEMFFSVTNESGKDQQTDIVFWFDDTDKKVEKVEKIEDSGNISEVGLRKIAGSPTSYNVQNRKDVKGYTAGSQFEDAIVAGQTSYYRAIVKFPKGSNGEFFIEAFGFTPLEAGRPQTADRPLMGYGHLDPYYASGLVGMWSFNGQDTNWTSATEGTTNDLSGSGNTGTMTNMNRSTSPVPGISGQALSFDGSDDYVDAGNNSSLAMGSNNFTFEGWVNTAQSGQAALIGGDAGAAGLYLYSRVLRITKIGVADGPWSNWEKIPDNVWTHIAVVFDSSATTNNVKYYFNGVLDSTGTFDTDFNANAKSKYIGCWQPGTYQLKSLIDEVRIYNRALSQSEITDLYRAGAARLKVNTPESGYLTSGLVGMWSFDGSATNWTSATEGTTNDLSGNNNTGTMTNMSRSSSPVPGISGQALSFDGVDDYVNVGASPALNLISAVTVSLWFKADTFAPGTNPDWGDRYFGKGRDADQGSYTIDAFVGGISFMRVGAGESDRHWASKSFSPSTGVWYHVVGVDNGTSLKLYINGIESASNTDTFTRYYVSVSGRIGMALDDRFAADAIIDEVRIYNRALSQSEITDLYRLGAARLKANTPTTGYLTSGLVGEWSFNGADTNWTSATAGTTNDLSGNNNTGTMTNMSRSSSPVPGISGQALSFDGSDDYVLASGQFPVTNSWQTVSVWVKFNAFGSGNNSVLAERGDPIYNEGIQLMMYDNKVQWVITSTYPWPYVLIGNTILSLGVWYHIVGTVDGSNLRLYINGVQDTASPVAFGGSEIRGAGTQYLFGGGCRGTMYFNGLIDEVRIYNRALSADEVLQLYNLGRERRRFSPLEVRFAFGETADVQRRLTSNGTSPRLFTPLEMQFLMGQPGAVAERNY